MSKPFYLTTPLYYVNDEPHIGHAYTTILADVLARYHRLFGRSVHFLTGLDEHGQKVAGAAQRLGREPLEHCELMAAVWKDNWAKLNVQYDDFIRTTEPRHESVVTEILQRLMDKGDIYREEYAGWYSIYEERFFTEKDLIDGKDPIGGRPVEWIKESNYFFRMSAYQQWLIDYYESHPDAVLPEFRLNEVKGFLRQPLNDLCISRPKSRLSWGIPIPWDREYVTYVWFDALINYYSATRQPPAGRQVHWPADYHLIGKDILTTHAVYWPIMLHAAGLEPPRHIIAHGWWLARDSAKMSKSAGNVVKPLELVERYGSDPFRYALIREMVLGQDAAFDEAIFINRYNSDLANDLGNLYSRLAKLWHRFNWGSYDGNAAYEDAVDRELADEFGLRCSNLNAMVQGEVEALRLHSALEMIMSVVRGLNRAVDRSEPWRDGKGDSPEVALSMTHALERLHHIATLLEPVMPTKMAKLKQYIKPDRELAPQQGLTLFPRIEKKSPQASEDKAAASKAPHREVHGDLVDIADFNRIKLVAAVVESAQRVPASDRLLALQLSIGSERRSVVAGIAASYKPEQIVGLKVLFVANLKPAKLKGVISEGMILAADLGEGRHALITPSDEVPVGSRIK